MDSARKRQLGVVLSALVTAATMWLPWMWSGAATRTSFGALRAAQRLGLDEIAPLRIVWFILPVGFAGAAMLALFGRLGWAASVLAAAAATVGVAALFVATNPAGHAATIVALGAAACSLVVSGAVGRFVLQQRGRNHR